MAALWTTTTKHSQYLDFCFEPPYTTIPFFSLYVFFYSTCYDALSLCMFFFFLSPPHAFQPEQPTRIAQVQGFPPRNVSREEKTGTQNRTWRGQPTPATVRCLAHASVSMPCFITNSYYHSVRKYEGRLGNTSLET